MREIIHNFAILIATKDRPHELKQLLMSIKSSSSLPGKVFIVFSGQDISYLKKEFENEFSIDIIESPIASQSFQKYTGISSLMNAYSWILFLDDDLILHSDSLRILSRDYLNNATYRDYVGFGLGISNINYKELHFTEKFLLSCFKMYSKRPGAITCSGHAQSYLQSKNEVQVDWLNGLSVWSARVLTEYSREETVKPYSAYEDVIFSYKVKKHGKLLYIPKVTIQSQNDIKEEPLNVQRFVYGGFCRYQFVSAHEELSKFWLLLSQILRSVHFIVCHSDESTYFKRFKVATNTWCKLFTLAVSGINGTHIWRYINTKD
jgi:hypothetical protein